MNIKIKTLAIAVFAVANTVAQDCEKYLMLQKGTSVTQTSYNAKEKETGKNITTCISTSNEGGKIKAVFKGENFDEKGKLLSSANLNFECVGGKIFIDMQNFVNAESTQGFKDATVTIEGDKQLEMPLNPTNGQVLPDAKMKMIFSKDGMPIGKMDFNILDRKVETTEKITTPAGTFDCIKMSYRIETKTNMMAGTMEMPGIKFGMDAISWFNADYGSVRTESYRKEKMMGYTILTEVKK